MDKLKAYEILGLQPECSKEEIKEAYATLSKKFHPEDHPEEFQQIHEAYIMLVRGDRGRRKSTSEERTPVQREPIQRETVEKTSTEEKKRFREIEEEVNDTEAEETEQTYDFEESLNKAEQENRQRLHQVTVQALNEFQILLLPEYKEKLKLFQSFFAKEMYAEVLKKAEFIGGLASLLENGRLKKAIYDYMIDFYRLRGCTENQLIPEAAALYRVLDEKRGMHAKQKENLVYGIPAGVVAGVTAGFRSSIRSKEMFGVIVLCAVAVILLIRLYRKLYENHSSLFAQTIIAVGLTVSQFGAIMIDFYGTAFGTVDNENIFAALLMVSGLLWLIALGILSVILKIKRKMKK